MNDEPIVSPEVLAALQGDQTPLETGTRRILQEVAAQEALAAETEQVAEKMSHPLVIYGSWGLKDFGDGTYQAARAIGPLILVRPEKRDDKGLLAHELTHVGQWAMGLVLGLFPAVLVAPYCPYWTALAGLSVGLHHVAYALSPAYRMWAEVQAYRRQLRCYPDNRSEKFAAFLAERYGLRITVAEALKAIRGS